MEIEPFVVTVSGLRRRLADLIDEVNRRGHPVFVTQYGRVTAILVSREEYASWRSRDARRPDLPHPTPPRAPEAPRLANWQRSSWLTPLPTRKVWTDGGLCDFAVAQVLAEQGVDTELVLTDEGWLTDDEG